MTRLSRIDRWLLLTLLPVVVLVIGLHVREAARTGLALPPVFATPPAGPDAYPHVGGRPLEVDTAGTALRVGDTLIRIGGTDLRGKGYLGFMGAALAEAGTSLRTPLVYERDGVRHETVLRMRPFAVPWLRVPFLLATAAMVFLVLVRLPDTRMVQKSVVALSALILTEAIFPGGPPLQTEISQSLFLFGGGVAFPLVVLWLAEFPSRESVRRRLPGLAILAALSGALWVGFKSMYLLGGPIPAPKIPIVVSVADSLEVAIVVAVLSWNYFHADAIGRRRIKWVVYGTWAAGLVMVPTLAAPAVDPHWPWFPQMLALAGVLGALVPLGFLVAIVGYNLLDIDRLIGATASYTLLGVGLLAAALAIVPLAAQGAARSLGLDAPTTRLFLSLLLAAAVVPLGRRLRPRLEGFFFPERRALESGVEALLADLSGCRDEETLVARATQRVHELFHATRAVGYRVVAGEFVPVEAAGTRESTGPPLSEEHPLVPVLAERGSPLVLGTHPAGGARTAPAALGGRFVDTLGTPVLLPVRRDGALVAFVALGPKRSGDVYTSTDLALLAAVAEAASRELAWLQAADELARERLRAAEEGRRRRAAEEAQLARSRQLAVASHDLRQPLHALGLFADALEKRVSDDEARALVDRIRASTTALREMFDALIDVSRLDHGAIEPEVSEFDLDALLERLAGEAEPRAQAKGLALRVMRSGARVRSDAVLLGRVVQNLVSNAVRYTTEGWVEVGGETAGDSVRIWVADTGPGIPSEAREEVFQEFVRLPSSGSVQGLGLGLSIVDRLARLLGHPLALAERPGGGSVFTLTLPGAAGVAEGAAGRPAIAPPGSLEGRVVLVIDDDLEILAGMRSLIEAWGARVVLAASTAEALDAMETLGRPPDAVIADYRLAGGEKGTDAIETLRRRARRALPALVVTGSRSAELAEDLAARSLPQLPKPVPPARLRAALQELVRGR